MLYRVNQFLKAIHPKKITRKERAWIIHILPTSALNLFFNQSLIEQRHALDVALDLYANNQPPPSRKLLIAALLHDCGKSRYQLRIWERIYIVLVGKAPVNLYHFFLHSHSLFSNPLLLAEHHPAWGSELATSAGLDKDVINLIRYHHCPQSEDGILLYEADNRH